MNCPYGKNYCYDKKILHITDITNGVLTELHLCEKCSSKYCSDFLEKQALIKDKIKNLEAKMKKAISVENYEIAGVLKTKIQELKNLI